MGEIAELTKRYIEEARFGKKEAALFYLGVMMRSLADTGTTGDYNIFAVPGLGGDIEKTGLFIIDKLAENGLEKALQWAIDGFHKSYSKEIEKTSVEEKRFYITSGAAFYATCSNCPKADEWMSATEAADRWKIDSSTIRHSIRRGRFKEGECRKSGDMWLIRKSAMERLYGKAED